MIISSYDTEKFKRMDENANSPTPAIMSDQDDTGELKAFSQGVKSLSEENGIIVSVKASKRKGQEVRSMMEQSGAFEINISN